MGDTASDAKTALMEATVRLDRLENQFNKMGNFPAASNESGTQNNATWNVNAGGVGVWLCVTSCIVMLLLSMFLLFAYLDIRDEQRVTAAHQATLYMLLPEVRKLVNQQMNPHKKEEDE